ncbi:hypothetical protein H2200_008768 [Cladophialophora chaetospira]|uniref:Heterokaryon incompatibility domain-containing protein n=1 Tax=Cladophialophora chaetospira TaxID=386627 RepID=A0AA39CFW7_9EURO|nr:hypothetical protein H2200_008768 [Cladophialophora chaetospira]
MWLLDTTTLELREFLATPPPYAILSHTWADEEVTFQELKDISFQNFGSLEAKRKAGYEKVKRFCAQAKSDGLAYAWADTCCIDKRSSAELSEAINSMYRWYSEAHLCYAYLSDVSTLSSNGAVLGFDSSRWFKRGWCLQELISPMHVIFFDKNWLEVGTKASLLDDLHEMTSIPRQALMQPLSIYDYSVAERMSWASQRETSRVEDMAYSLLGIFRVNMPLLYGEGKKAFHRLQLQILSQSSDHSIFAWTALHCSTQPVSVLADSPARFTIDSAHPIVRTGLTLDEINITNLGVSIKLPIIQQAGLSMAVLECARQGQAIAIRVTEEVMGPRRRARVPTQNLVYLSETMAQRAQGQSVYLLIEVPDILCASENMQIDLLLDVDGDHHGLDTIYSCRSWNWSDDDVLYASYDRRIWTSTRPENSRTLSPLIVTDLPPVPQGGWLAVAFKGLYGTCFSLVFGPKDGRVWCNGIVGLELLRLVESGAVKAILEILYDDPISAEAWRYFRDRSSYKLDDRRTMRVAIKLMTALPSPRYRVEVVQEQISGTPENHEI